jgi:hypothetical protein
MWPADKGNLAMWPFEKKKKKGCASLNYILQFSVGNQDSHTYKTKGKIIVKITITFIFSF